MAKKKQSILISSIALIFLVSFLSYGQSVDTIILRAYSEKVQSPSGGYLVSVAEAAGHIVYSGTEGYSTYGLYLKGQFTNTACPTKIVAKIYTQAYERWHGIPDGGRPTPITVWYYVPTPLHLIDLSQDFDYNANTPTQVSWNVGAQIFAMSIGVSFSGVPTGNVASNNAAVVNNWRYLGAFTSQSDWGQHAFTALIRLHTSNQVATTYAEGYSHDGVTEWVERVQIKIVWEFYWQAFWTWYSMSTYTMVLGNGVNELPNEMDLSSIPLVIGTTA